MPSRKKRPRKGFRRLSSRTDTATLRATFLTVVSEKLAQRLRDLGGRVGKAPTAVAREKSLIESFLEGFEKGKLCGQLEQNLDSAIDFLQENGNNPALQEECDSVRKAAVEALNTYANNC
jgi:hypothetical protein